MKNQTLLTVLCVTILFLQIEVLLAQPKLEFSHERGFYKSSFQLFIKSSEQGGIIKYTLDGSDPRNSSIAKISGSPAEITINPYINNGRAVTAGVIVRACAISDADTSRTYTQSYIFLDEVKYQRDVSAELLPYWPDKFQMPIAAFSPNLIPWMTLNQTQYMNLAVSPKVVYRDENFSSFENDLLSIPVYSLVTAPSNLFDQQTGIYLNGTWSGKDWERPASLEIISQSIEGIQVNTGIRIRGGYSSMGNTPKHAFRLFFRKEYGDSKLKSSLFGINGADEFDRIDLRCEQNNSWHGGNSKADYIHEAFSREIQGDMNQPYTRSSYFHLFLNGMYWGLYETQERVESNFAKSYLGGDNEDYDVVKSSAASIDYPPFTLEATDGNLNSSKALWDIAIEGFNHNNYFKAMGLNPDGTLNPAYPKYLDVENLINYVMIIYFSANTDGPGKLELDEYGNTRINNFFGIFNHKNPDGFKYCIHDNETAYAGINDNITNIPTPAGWTFETFNPIWLHQRLIENPDYKQKFADIAFKLLSDKGVLSPEKNISRFQKRVDMIDDAIVGETARWGNMRGATILTKENTWIPTINFMLQTYFPQRSQIVMNQLKSMGWMNQLTPPAFDESQFTAIDNGEVIKGMSFKLINNNTSGQIYYTTNNTDPRASCGAIAEGALQYTSEINASKTVFLKARIKDGDSWSPVQERVIVKSDGKGLRLTEISYNPKDQIIGNDTLKSKDLEFIEIKNFSDSGIELSGYEISGGISYHFPMGSMLTAGGFAVIASDSASFRKLYGFSPFGQFSGNLSNGGETFNLLNPLGTIFATSNYNNDGIWYSPTDGCGFTLVSQSFYVPQVYDSQLSWRISTNWLGSPGADDPSRTDSIIVFSEVMANSKKPFVDFIELYNPANSHVNIGNWFISDEKDNPDKWKIPSGMIIQPKSHVAFNEGHYISDSLQFSANEFGSAFSLSKGGEKIYLFSGNNEGKPMSFISEYEFGPTEENTSFGIFISQSKDDYNVQLDSASFGVTNGSAKLSPVIFKTIMYHPIDENFEFLVLKNRTDTTVNLFCEEFPDITWKVKGIDFDFPKGTTLAAGDSLFLVEKMQPSEIFKSTMNLPEGVKVFNYKGKLNNSAEMISIQKPLPVETDTTTEFKYIDLEEIFYSDQLPWPRNADGGGYALIRKDENAFGNDPANWTSIFKALPYALAGNNSRVRIDTKILLDGSGSRDPQNLPLTYEWKFVSIPAGSKATLSNSKTLSPQFSPDQAGNYLISLQVNNGTNKSAPAFVSVFAYQNTAPVTLYYTRTYNINLNQSLLLESKDSYDPDYEALSHTWGIVEKPAGSSIAIDNENSKTFNFTPDMIGSFRFSIISSDNQLSGKSVTITVKVSPANEIETSTTNNFSIYPNPVSDEAFINFNLKESSKVNISITDIRGRSVISRDYGWFEPGNQIVTTNFSGLSVPRGVYFINLRTSEYSINKKVYYLPAH